MKRFILLSLLFIALSITSYSVWNTHLNYNFETITKNKVYKSGVIPPSKIHTYIEKHNIKTVVDLRIGNVQDKLNPANQAEIDKEKIAVENIKGAKHINIPSLQIPTEESLDKFFAIMDNPENYPILVHCHHGVGRAELFSALYRIEYENFSNEKARRNTRIPLAFSNFSKSSEKGKYLKAYKKRYNDTYLTSTK